MLKSLLLHLDGGARDAVRLDAAARLAREHGAHLEALFIEPQPDMPVGALGRGASAAYLEETADASDRAAARSERQFHAAPALADLSARWTCERGDAAAILARRSRTADLVMLGEDADGAPLDAVLDGAATPLLVLPERSGPAPLGKRVLVAWDESASAARALRGALPLLRRAVETVVLLVGDEATRRARLAPVQDFLARHDVEAAPHAESGPEADVGGIIAARADDLGCDLVVMGAQGHSRLAELLLGGTTRRLLHRMARPVLLSR